MGLDVSTIANLGSSGVMSVIVFLIVRWFLTHATKSMNEIRKSMVANTLVLGELYKLNLVDSATRKGITNGAQADKEAAQQYRNLLESMKKVEEKLREL